MIQPLLEADIANGVAEVAGVEVDVGIACITHDGDIVWQSPIAVPTSIEGALDRIMAHLTTVRFVMEEHWPEVAPYVNWWVAEPGEYEEWPLGLQA